MPRHVYQLVATFDDPFGCGGGPLERRSTTVFTTVALAESRFETIRGQIRDKFKVRPDYPIRVEAKPLEIIED